MTYIIILLLVLNIITSYELYTVGKAKRHEQEKLERLKKMYLDLQKRNWDTERELEDVRVENLETVAEEIKVWIDQESLSPVELLSNVLRDDLTDRHNSGLSYAEIARQSGVGQKTIWNIVNNKTKAPHKRTRELLKKYLYEKN